MRNRRCGFQFRIPHSAFRIVVLAAACSPVSNRPNFAPFPEAVTIVVDQPPLRVLGQVQDWLMTAGLELERASVEDRFVETAWYDTRTRRSTRGRGATVDAGAAVKLRCWVDPEAPGKSKLTVEVVIRPRWDPSRTERDLETFVPLNHEGRKLIDQLLAGVKEKNGG